MVELWDLYDGDRRPLGKTVARGKHDGCAAYHIVVVVAVKNRRGEFLITLRDKSKPFGGKWEFTGGSALSGESSERAALRETREETGIDHTNSRRTQLHTYKRIWNDGNLGWHGDFWDYWLFEADFPIEKVVLQKGETSDARWASLKEIKKINERGEFFNADFLKYILNYKE